MLCPPGEFAPPAGALAAAIAADFGSLEALQGKLSTAAAGVQGSGWGWLGYSKDLGKLVVATTANQDPLEATTGLVPVFGIDVWEVRAARARRSTPRFPPRRSACFALRSALGAAPTRQVPRPTPHPPTPFSFFLFVARVLPSVQERAAGLPEGDLAGRELARGGRAVRGRREEVSRRRARRPFDTLGWRFGVTRLAAEAAEERRGGCT